MEKLFLIDSKSVIDNEAEIRYIIHNQFGEYWQWRVRGDKAAKTLESIIPYLIVKRRQAEIVKEFKNSVVEAKGEKGSWYGRVSEELQKSRQKLYEECKALNSRRLCRERLSERASGLFKSDDAIVRSGTKIEVPEVAEMATR